MKFDQFRYIFIFILHFHYDYCSKNYIMSPNVKVDNSKAEIF